MKIKHYDIDVCKNVLKRTSIMNKMKTILKNYEMKENQ